MPKTVQIAPYNIWTRAEFDKWIGDSVRAHVAESLERFGLEPPTDIELQQLMAMVVSEINYNIVPAGNG
jgi:hypothetical protein